VLRPTTTPLTPRIGLSQPTGAYFLTDVQLAIPNPVTAVFHAKLHGPVGARVWARAWLSNEADGTLAETASAALIAGEDVTLTVNLDRKVSPEVAYIRIESAPLRTEHVVSIRLSDESAERGAT
jgi:hypothetical protein